MRDHMANPGLLDACGQGVVGEIVQVTQAPGGPLVRVAPTQEGPGATARITAAIFKELAENLAPR